MSFLRGGPSHLPAGSRRAALPPPAPQQPHHHHHHQQQQQQQQQHRSPAATSTSALFDDIAEINQELSMRTQRCQVLRQDVQETDRKIRAHEDSLEQSCDQMALLQGRHRLVYDQRQRLSEDLQLVVTRLQVLAESDPRQHGKRIAQFEGERLALEENNAALQNAIEELNVKVASQVRLLDAVESSRSANRAKLQQLDEALVAAQQESNASAEHEKKLQQQLGEAHDTQARLSEEAQQVRHSLARLRNQIDDAGERVASLRQDAQNQETLFRARCDDVEQENTRLLDDLVHQRSQVYNLESDVTELESERSLAQRSLEQRTAAAQQVSEECSNTTTRVESRRKELQALEAKRDAHAEQLDRLRRELARLVGERRGVEAALAAFHTTSATERNGLEQALGGLREYTVTSADSLRTMEAEQLGYSDTVETYLAKQVALLESRETELREAQTVSAATEQTLQELLHRKQDLVIQLAEKEQACQLGEQAQCDMESMVQQLHSDLVLVQERAERQRLKLAWIEVVSETSALEKELEDETAAEQSLQTGPSSVEDATKSADALLQATQHRFLTALAQVHVQHGINEAVHKEREAVRELRQTLRKDDQEFRKSVVSTCSVLEQDRDALAQRVGQLIGELQSVENHASASAPASTGTGTAARRQSKRRRLTRE